MDTTGLERADHLLAQHQEHLEAELSALTGGPAEAEGIPFGKRVGEGTAAAAHRMSAVSTQEQLLRSLADVRHARERVVDGTYGTCEVCGDPIPPERLEARPHVSRCVRDA